MNALSLRMCLNSGVTAKQQRKVQTKVNRVEWQLRIVEVICRSRYLNMAYVGDKQIKRWEFPRARDEWWWSRHRLDAASTAPTSREPARRLQSLYYQGFDVSVMDMWIISLRCTLLSVMANVSMGKQVPTLEYGQQTWPKEWSDSRWGYIVTCGNPRSLRYRVIIALPRPRLSRHTPWPELGRAVNARTELGRHIFIITSITKQEDYLSRPTIT